MKYLSLNDGIRLSAAPDDNAILRWGHRSDLLGVWIIPGSASELIRREWPGRILKKLGSGIFIIGFALMVVLILSLITGVDMEKTLQQLITYSWIFPLVLLAYCLLLPVPDPKIEAYLSISPVAYEEIGPLSDFDRVELFAIEDIEERYDRLDRIIAERLPPGCPSVL